MAKFNIDFTGWKSKFITDVLTFSRNYHMADKNGHVYLCGCAKTIYLHKSKHWFYPHMKRGTKSYLHDQTFRQIKFEENLALYNNIRNKYIKG